MYKYTTIFCLLLVAFLSGCKESNHKEFSIKTKVRMPLDAPVSLFWTADDKILIKTVRYMYVLDYRKESQRVKMAHDYFMGYSYFSPSGQAGVFSVSKLPVKMLYSCLNNHDSMESLRTNAEEYLINFGQKCDTTKLSPDDTTKRRIGNIYWPEENHYYYFIGPRKPDQNNVSTMYRYNVSEKNYESIKDVLTGKYIGSAISITDTNQLLIIHQEHDLYEPRFNTTLQIVDLNDSSKNKKIVLAGELIYWNFEHLTQKVFVGLLRNADSTQLVISDLRTGVYRFFPAIGWPFDLSPDLSKLAYIDRNRGKLIILHLADIR